MIYLDLFLTFLKIGALTFGGGYAMLPLIAEDVAAHGWMDLSELIDFIAVSESTPGPFAINAATYVGAHTAGVLGSVCATFGVVLPSFAIILIVAKFIEAFRESKLVKGAMTGLKPAVIGLIGAAVISIGKTVFFPHGILAEVFSDPVFYISLAIFALALVFSFVKPLKKLSPIIVILIAAVLGIGAGYTLNL